MRNYDRVHPRKPEGIEERKAYIVGGGIAGLSAAAFLVRDAQMPGKNITVYDQLPVFGGSMDAAGSAANGYVSRGERELEPYMECLWDLFGSLPSLYEEGRTVLDETRECNKNWEIDSQHRLWEQGFQPHDESTMDVTPEIQEQMIKMMLTEEDQLEDVTIEQWFSPAFFQSQLLYYWSSMLAFHPYHSLIEMRRYAVRFMHQLHLIRSLRGILRTKYDQYNSLIRPLQKYLADHGVNFVSGATVMDMDIRIEGNDKTVTALQIGEGSDERIVPVAEKDLVFFTNGSMTQNSTQASPCGKSWPPSARSTAIPKSSPSTPTRATLSPAPSPSTTIPSSSTTWRRRPATPPARAAAPPSWTRRGSSTTMCLCSPWPPTSRRMSSSYGSTASTPITPAPM